MTMNIELLSGW